MCIIVCIVPGDGSLGNKLASDELKTFYYEAKGAQPGRHTPDEVLRWFWRETAAGEVFVAMRDHAAQSPDPGMKGIATLSLVPRAALPLLAAGRA